MVNILIDLCWMDSLLENVGFNDFKTVASNLIHFRGERLFLLSVALKHSGDHGLHFTSVDIDILLLNLALRIADVVCGKEWVDGLMLFAGWKKTNLKGEKKKTL